MRLILLVAFALAAAAATVGSARRPILSHTTHPHVIQFGGHTVDTQRHPDMTGWSSGMSVNNAVRFVTSLFHTPVTDESDARLAGAHLATGALDAGGRLGPEEDRMWLVHVSGEAGSVAEKRELVEAELGVKLGAYIPHNTFLLVGSRAVANRVSGMPGSVVDWVGAYPTEAKLVGELVELAETREHSAEPLEGGGASMRMNVHLAPREGRTMDEAQAVARRWSRDAVSAGIPLSFAVESEKHIVATYRKLEDIFTTLGGSGAADLSKEDQPEQQQAEAERELTEADVVAAARWIASRGQAYTVELAPKYQLFNEFAQWITQSGTFDQRPIWDRGLRGENILVGCADSGLDTSHCMFSDTTAIGPSHRKIESYTVQPNNDNTDDDGGHGTHVAGSIAGNAAGTGVSNADIIGNSGAAPLARLSFHDIGQTGGGLSVPSDIERFIFQASYDEGARIHSNSWGANVNQYTSNAQQVDSMTFDNPDMLILYAAGNDGQAAGKTSGTVGSPATAKNCLTVGASQTSNAGWLASLTYQDWEGRRQIAIDQLEIPPSQQAGYDCCASSNRNVQQFCCESFVRSQIAASPERHDDVNVAEFSSRGPTSDGRIKPEIMAPGQNIVSARANSPCNSAANALLSNAGTSMATPITAGSAALMREYFELGYYPSGAANLGTATITNPTAALMIAMLANSAVALTGEIDVNNDGNSWTRLGEIYPAGIYQGFGRIQLDNVLWFAGNTDFAVYLDDSSSVSDGEDRDYCFTTTAAGTVKVTLAWSDPPAQTNSGLAAVNNLDVYAGTTSASALAGNFREKRDERNNVEHVIYENVPSLTTFNVKVRGKSVPQGSGGQRYALVIRGPFDHGLGVSNDCSFSIAADQFPAAAESDHGAPPGAAIGGGVGGGLIVLLAIGAVIYYCYMQRQKKRAAAGGH